MISTSIIPQNIWAHTFSFLDLESQFNCQRISKLFRACFNTSPYDNLIEPEKAWESGQTAEFLMNQCLPTQYKKRYINYLKNYQTPLRGICCTICIIGFILIGLTIIKRKRNDWHLLPAFEQMAEFAKANEKLRSYSIISGNRTIREIPPYTSIQSYQNRIDSDIPVYFTYFIAITLQVISVTYTIFKTIYMCVYGKQLINKQFKAAFVYPKTLLQDPILKDYACQDVLPLIPVSDCYNNKFDYVQIKHHVSNTIKCPITKKSLTLADLTFEHESFIAIQSRLKQLKREKSPLVNKIPLFIFNFANEKN